MSDYKEYIMQLKERINDKEKTVLSRILKIERIRNNLTLEEVAEGICSVSYLCKVENNEILPKESYLCRLFEKVNIDIDTIKNQNSDVTINKIIELAIENDKELIGYEFSNATNNIYNNANNFLECLYYLSHNDIEKFEEKNKELENIKSTFTTLEGVFFIYININHLITKGYYEEALYYLKGLEQLNLLQINRLLYLLIAEQNIEVATVLNLPVRIQKYYDEFNKFSTISYNKDRKLLINVIYNYYVHTEYSSNVVDDLKGIDYSLVNPNFRDKIMFYDYLTRLDLIDNTILFKQLEENGFYANPRMLSICSMLAYKIDKTEYFIKVMEMTDNVHFVSSDSIHYKFVYFIILYASNINNDDLSIYIKSEIIPYLNKETFKPFNKIYEQVYLNLLIEQSKYKDAFTYVNSVYQLMENKNNKRCVSKLLSPIDYGKKRKKK